MSYAAQTKPRYASNSDDGLLFRVLSLPTARLSNLLEKLVGRPEVIRAGWSIRERRISPRSKEKRDAEWTRLHDEEDLSYAEIAHADHVSRDTVAKAVQRYRQRRDSESMSTADSGYAS